MNEKVKVHFYCGNKVDQDEFNKIVEHLIIQPLDEHEEVFVYSLWKKIY
jgi:hypothetical protein